MYESGKKPNKPKKLYLNTGLSTSKKNFKINDQSKQNKNSQETLPENENRKIHESKLLKIQQLEKELKKYENQNELASNENNLLITKQNKLSDKYNNIIKEIDFEKLSLEKIKDINRLKNHEYLQKLRIKEELDNKENQDNEQNGENNLNTHSSENDENRFSDALNGFNFLLNLSRFRRMAAEEDDDDDDNDNDNNEDNENNENNDNNENNNDEGPPMTYNQLQSLPSSIYLKKDNSTEKCIICEFEFCYNDEVTTLKCNHSFHKNCIINRLRARNSSKCPNCGASII